ncbi:Serine/threonine protein kinase [Handroanthus impetiginosus]|uniref:non-specific serine/threonine protein kinase n=1 Tax=Handroanthus impetiginosus TaxID=429701 RepID=A0A2G9H782_9LAMI|nr:Serine/threonine protein kinase [Handroanthus impetiginosus]
MNKHNISTVLLSFYLCVFFFILLSKTSSGAHYQYESCVPKNCGHGKNIRFPFYVPGLQESYCGYPGYELTCEDKFPVLKLSENDYVVDDIFYQNRSLRVHNVAVLGFEGRGCLSRIRNATFLSSQFDYVNSTPLHLFSSCREPLPDELSRYNVSCGSPEDGKNWALVLYDKDENLTNIAMKTCEENIVTPVEEYVNEGMVSDLEGLLRSGFMMKWTAIDCSLCENSGGHCGFNATSTVFVCFCPDGPHSDSCKPRKQTLKKKIFLIGGTSLVALIFTSTLLFLLFRRKYKLLKLISLQPKPERQQDIELFLKNNGNLVQKRFKYSDLKKITNSFRENLGKGGYGSVYKGRFPNGRLIAVKILNESKENGEDFINEVASISRTSHVNIVTLIGFCYEGSKRALVYDFMPNGSLDKFIQNTVDWQKLFEIVVGIARGLEYLHRGCNMRILHFDIKPHNILLDKDFNPKISDFGLAKLCPNRSSIVSMSAARGTIGYIAPEVFCKNFGEVSYKSDVYSYGMMILEIAGGRKNIDPEEVDRSSEKYFPQYIYKQLEMDDKNGVPEGIMNEDESQCVKRKMIIVGLWCIQTDPNNRPSMSRVVEMLEGRLESLRVPPKPYLSSPKRLRPSFSTFGSV